MPEVELETPRGRLQFVYEAGPCGFGIYRHLTTRGEACVVVSPSMVPKRSGDRVKTDRRDATKLARSYRAGDLTPVWVPDGAHEALRALVRAREAAKKDQQRARHRVGKFLLRHGRRPSTATQAWTARSVAWVKTARGPCEGLRLPRRTGQHPLRASAAKPVDSRELEAPSGIEPG